MKNTFALKFSLAALIVLFILAKPAFSQPRSRTAQSGKCLSVKQAEGVIRELKPISEPNVYALEGSVRYAAGTSLSDVQVDYPLDYLFYRSGYLRLEDNGAYTFKFLTSKGEQLSAQYPQGIPVSTQTLVSVNRVRCVGRKANVKVALVANPTQIAIALLGATISKIRPFDHRTETIDLIYRNGGWQADDYQLRRLEPH